MDKKVLASIVDDIVKDTATAQGISEGEARALVGIVLRKSKDAIVKAVTVTGIATPAV